MKIQSLYQTYKRIQTLQTDRISSLPIVILMPHSSCNCRCVMCDVWKGNSHLKQLSESDIVNLLQTLKRFGTQQVLMSGGEALLNPNFFRFCEILKSELIKISLLSTGLTVKKHAGLLVKWVDDIIISLDGDETLHNEIRNIPAAFHKLKEGVEALHQINSQYPVSGRTVIHRLNFRRWPAIIDTAREIGLKSISFLPADVSSTAFNRDEPWSGERQHEILLREDELGELKKITEYILNGFKHEFDNGFIAESPVKFQKIYSYYAAFYGQNDFPYKKCNAPWVSTVIEADGSVRPCFFHEAYGNLKTDSLDKIVNNPKAVEFRKNLDMDTNETCLRCVCYLNLRPSLKL